MTDSTQINNLHISSVTVNDYTYTVNIENFNILPGVKYNLNMELSCPCLSEVDPNISIYRTHHKIANTSEYSYKDADFGAVLDIYQIDDSFNLTINNKPLYSGGTHTITGSNTQSYTTNEIQFQGFRTWGEKTFPNIEFVDGTRWGVDVSGTKEIWEFNGVESIVKPVDAQDVTKIYGNPIFKIHIERSGDVVIYGSKSTKGGPDYFPLRLINGKVTQPTYNTDNISIRSGTVYGNFNKIESYKDGTPNIIKLEQLVSSQTLFYGHIVGKKVVPCK